MKRLPGWKTARFCEVLVKQPFVDRNVEIFLTFTGFQDKAKQTVARRVHYNKKLFVFQWRAFWSYPQLDKAFTVQTWRRYQRTFVALPEANRCRAKAGNQDARRWEVKHAVTLLKGERMVPKPALWSWHLIPTSCRLSEQLQGRTRQLSCNDQFDTTWHTQQSQNLKRNILGRKKIICYEIRVSAKKIFITETHVTSEKWCFTTPIWLTHAFVCSRSVTYSSSPPHKFSRVLL